MVKRKERKDALMFRLKLDELIADLYDWERRWRCLDGEQEKKERELSFRRLQTAVSKKAEDLDRQEKLLFFDIVDLFALKHRVNRLNEVCSLGLSSPSGVSIGCIGPLGAAKSTIARALIEDLQADKIVKEEYDKNPYWRKSQTEPSQYMLRSQIWFVLSNIFSDMRVGRRPGIAVSDTSTLTDILMWVEWYRRTGHLTKKEHRIYQDLIRLLRPIIPKPTLLVALLPDDVTHLIEGIKRRQQSEPERKGELVFVKAPSLLQMQIDIVKQVVKTVPSVWKVRVLPIKVNPIKVYEDLSVRDDCVKKIKSNLVLQTSHL